MQFPPLKTTADNRISRPQNSVKTIFSLCLFGPWQNSVKTTKPPFRLVFLVPANLANKKNLIWLSANFCRRDKINQQFQFSRRQKLQSNDSSSLNQMSQITFPSMNISVNRPRDGYLHREFVKIQSCYFCPR